MVDPKANLQAIPSPLSLLGIWDFLWAGRAKHPTIIGSGELSPSKMSLVFQRRPTRKRGCLEKNEWGTEYPSIWLKSFRWVETIETSLDYILQHWQLVGKQFISFGIRFDWAEFHSFSILCTFRSINSSWHPLPIFNIAGKLLKGGWLENLQSIPVECSWEGRGQIKPWGVDGCCVTFIWHQSHSRIMVHGSHDWT